MSNKKNSQKGKQGHQVGAPVKPVKWPAHPFVLKSLFNLNKQDKTAGKGQCQLSIRNKVTEGVAAGTIIQLAPVYQPGHAVGRPSDRFVLTENFDPAKMTKLADWVKPEKKAPTKTKAKTKRAKKTATVVDTANVVPAVPPATDNVTPTVPANDVVVVNAAVEQAPEIPVTVEAPAAVVETPVVEVPATEVVTVPA